MHNKAYDQLEEKYPFMKRKPLKDANYIDNLYFAFGMEFGKGWYDLIDMLCSNINSELEKHPELREKFEVIQVKEKYGGLRFYVNSGNSTIHNYIDAAEKESYNVCELCGKRGTLCTSNPTGKAGWYRTLCDGCAEVQQYVKAL